MGWAEALARRATGLGSFVREGLRLARLDPDGLNQATLRQYEYRDKHHDRDYNLSGLHDWERAAIDAHFSRCTSLLVPAAGGGREAIALAAAGFEVYAFDCVPSLVQLARELLAEHNASATVQLAAPDRVPPGAPVSDGAVVGWGGWMHIPTAMRRVRFLEQVARHVRPGAPVLVSFALRSRSVVRYGVPYAVASALRFARRQPQQVEWGDTVSGTFDHHFSEGEARSMIRAAGLKLAKFDRDPYPHLVANTRA